MLSNTLTLTIGALPAITLTRKREGDGQAIYAFDDTDRSVSLTVRQEVRTNAKTKQKMKVFNLSLVYTTADTPTVLGKTYTASFTGQFQDFSDPAFEGNLVKALHATGATVMSNLTAGEY
jgi:hypothetical protein